MDRNQLLSLCRTIHAELLPRFPEIQGVRFIINNRFFRCLGRAQKRGAALTVELSGPLLTRSQQNDQHADDTIRHELAHIVAYVRHSYAGHGYVWQTIAKSVGAIPRTCVFGIKAGDEITLACVCGWSVEVSERKCRRLDNKNRAVVCKKCRHLMDYPWKKPLPVVTPAPHRILFQRT